MKIKLTSRNAAFFGIFYSEKIRAILIKNQRKSRRDLKNANCLAFLTLKAPKKDEILLKY
jgi:hypothetical protein